MNIRDLSRPVTARSLNENLAKKFGEKINLEAFTLEQLQDTRNKLRTRLSQVKTTESYGSADGEKYTKNKLFLDVLNAEIAERENIELSNIKESFLAEEFVNEAVELNDLVDYLITGEVLNKGIYKKIERVVSDANAKLYARGGDPFFLFGYVNSRPVIVSSGSMTGLQVVGIGADEKVKRTIITTLVRKLNMGSVSDYSNMKEITPKAMEKRIRMASMRNESIIREGAEDQAELVMAAKDMVDRITGWMEDTAEMQTESMLDLADAIRDELGSESSEAFVSTVKPALEQLYTAMESTRQALTSGVGQLTGDETATEPMGADDEMGDDDMSADAEMEPIDDTEGNMDLDTDDFEADAAAAGGEEPAGREKRESVNRSKKKYLKR